MSQENPIKVEAPNPMIRRMSYEEAADRLRFLVVPSLPTMQPMPDEIQKRLKTLFMTPEGRRLSEEWRVNLRYSRPGRRVVSIRKFEDVCVGELGLINPKWEIIIDGDERKVLIYEVIE